MHEHGRQVVYELNGWEVDLRRRELRAQGVPVPLGNRAFQILAALVESAGELVTKDELMAPRVWPGAVVEENKLQVHVSAIRKALGTDRETVQTPFGRGYRLLGNWTVRKVTTPSDWERATSPACRGCSPCFHEAGPVSASCYYACRLRLRACGLAPTRPAGLGFSSPSLRCVQVCALERLPRSRRCWR